MLARKFIESPCDVWSATTPRAIPREAKSICNLIEGEALCWIDRIDCVRRRRRLVRAYTGLSADVSNVRCLRSTEAFVSGLAK